MAKTIRARFYQGKIEPLENLEMDEGAEVTITIYTCPSKTLSEDPLDLSFGGWKGLIDAEQFKESIYADRLIATRPEVEKGEENNRRF